MNMFILDHDPQLIAQYHCDKHVVKMITETFQMCGSALIRHKETNLPKTKSGKTLRGGYHHHPVTKWIGETRKNFLFACCVGIELCKEYTYRYNKIHFCQFGLEQMELLEKSIPDISDMTQFAQAMPDKYKHKCAITAYRNYYAFEKKALLKGFKFNKGRHEPQWLQELSSSPIPQYINVS